MCKVWRTGQPTVGIVQVGSLIFVVIVATWAAYLLQHWIHRREEAVAGESVERFSGAMRVLEKRTVPAMDGPAESMRPADKAAAGASMAGGGAESGTPDAMETVDAGPKSPLVARRAADREPTVAHQGAPMTSSPAPRRVAPAGPRPVTQNAPRPAARPAGSRPAPRPAGPRPAPRQAVVRVSRTRRIVRAAVLLLALLWVPVSVGLAIAHILLWISVPFAVLTVLAVLFWLRAEARADRARAARHEVSRRRRPAAPALTSDDTQVIDLPAATPATPATAATAAARATAGATAPTPSVPAAAAARPAAAASSAAYDGEADEARRAPGEPAGPLAEGMWRPVPVPPPTYTMKAKAEPRMTPAGIPADVFSTPEFAEEAEELDERALFVRRAANQ
jgi:hypothetical protein